MSEMIERVARAIARETYGGGVPGVSLDHEEWALCCNIARVTISAMRDPILAAVGSRKAIYDELAARRDPFAAPDTNPHERSQECSLAMDYVSADLAAMIDAALTETP
jgi:hypothetical protein